jgi:hypothetical protein
MSRLTIIPESLLDKGPLSQKRILRNTLLNLGSQISSMTQVEGGLMAGMVGAEVAPTHSVFTPPDLPSSVQPGTVCF